MSPKKQMIAGCIFGLIVGITVSLGIIYIFDRPVVAEGLIETTNYKNLRYEEIKKIRIILDTHN